jgi:hypothetical protein
MAGSDFLPAITPCRWREVISCRQRLPAGGGKFFDASNDFLPVAGSFLTASNDSRHRPVRVKRRIFVETWHATSLLFHSIHPAANFAAQPSAPLSRICNSARNIRQFAISAQQQ